MNTSDWWTVEIEGMPHFETAMKRVYAWYDNQIIDRPPVRFMAHNAFLETAKKNIASLSITEREAWWFNAELQVDLFLQSIEGRHFHAETFPVYFPNLGPDVYAAFYGAQLIFGEVTSWSVPLVEDWDQVDDLHFDQRNVYFQKIEELTYHALERCKGKFLVGYTDLHPGLDCVAAWRDPQQLCLDMIENPLKIKGLADLAIADFETIYNHFDCILKSAGQLSVSWMGIPTYQRMHIPSCDFSALISPEFFEEFGLPILREEVKSMSHNIFHVDGEGVAKNIEAILSVPEVNAVQWVQGVGDDYPIMQWVPFIKDLQAMSVPVIVDLSPTELEAFIDVMDPHGLYLWIASDDEEQERKIIERLNHWSVCGS